MHVYVFVYNQVKIKVGPTFLPATGPVKTQRRCRGIALLFLELP
jgi:hypothetical protein